MEKDLYRIFRPLPVDSHVEAKAQENYSIWLKLKEVYAVGQSRRGCQTGPENLRAL